MCDYSLQHVKSRAAIVGDKLTIKNFSTGTHGFVSPNAHDVAVCCLPGTELVFDDKIRVSNRYRTKEIMYEYATAIFRQVDKELLLTHHDAIEMPDGQVAKLTYLREGQSATVLQLPAQPKTEAEAKEQERLDVMA